MKIAMPELLAPAGNMERLTTAIDYGADAVYLGAQSMSLRNYADNFTPEQLRAGCKYAHGRNAKVYVACNAFARDEDLKDCLLYTSPSPRDRSVSRMPSSA